VAVITKPGAALGVLTGINVLNYADRFMLAAVLPLIISELGISKFRAGILAGSFIVVYSLVSPIIGWLGDRHRRLRLAAIGVIIWSAATLGSGLAPTFGWLLLARALVGVGEASYSVVTPSLIADLYAAERRGRALAVFYSALAVGPAIGYMVGGWIGKGYGWRYAFFVGGGPGFLLALTLLLLQEPTRGRLDREKVAALPLSLAQVLAALRRRPSYLFNTAAQTIYTFTMGGLANWMPTYYYQERHLPLERANLIFGGILLLAGFIGVLAGGQLGDRLARRHEGAHFTFSGWALIASMPFTAVAILSPRPDIFWPAMFMTLLLLFLNTGPLNAAMANVLPPDLRARGFALYTVAIHLLGDAVSPPAIGLAADHVGLMLPALACGLFLGVAGVVLLVGRRHLIADLRAAAR
jgi:MFS transporter, Spinster family, sphingosine-1-phosphate transporter